MVVRGRGFLCNGERTWIRILPLFRELPSAAVAVEAYFDGDDGNVICRFDIDTNHPIF